MTLHNSFNWLLVASSIVAAANITPTSTAEAQQTADQSIPELASGEGKQVADQLANMLEQRYLLPSVGARYATMLRRNASAGRYDQMNWKQLCDLLTADIQAVQPDGHIRINAGPVPRDDQRATGAGVLVPTEAGQWVVRGVAYLRLNRFSGQPSNITTIRRFLEAHRSAKFLILDLREHRGGRFEEMDTIMPFLFTRRTPLLDLAMAKGGYNEDGPMITSASLERVVNAPPTLVVRRHYAIPGPATSRLSNAQVLLLTSRRTASAGEHLAMALKRTHRAILIGERTAGANHFGGIVRITDHFNVFLPIGRTYDPVTGKDWEGVGVQPDIATPAGRALELALERAGVVRQRAGTLAKSIEERLAPPVD